MLPPCANANGTMWLRGTFPDASLHVFKCSKLSFRQHMFGHNSRPVYFGNDGIIAYFFSCNNFIKRGRKLQNELIKRLRFSFKQYLSSISASVGTTIPVRNTPYANRCFSCSQWCFTLYSGNDDNWFRNRCASLITSWVAQSNDNFAIKPFAFCFTSFDFALDNATALMIPPCCALNDCTFCSILLKS